MRSIVLREGILGAVVLSAFVVVFAVLGLTPSLRWIPEAPLLMAGVLVPASILVITGYRAARKGVLVGGGGLAGLLCGAIAGMVGGFAYLAHGKSPINVLAGLILGATGGALLGGAGAAWSRRGG